MTAAAAHARHLALLRLERAAGQAFGWLDEAGPMPRTAFAPTPVALTPVALGLATVVTAVAAALTWLV